MDEHVFIEEMIITTPSSYDQTTTNASHDYLHILP